MPYRRLSTRSRGVILFVSAVMCAATIVGSLWLRAVTLDERDAAICAKVDRVVIAIQALATSSGEPPQPGDYGYSYWAAHPEERQNRSNPEDAVNAFIDAATCDPDNINGGGAE